MLMISRFDTVNIEEKLAEFENTYGITLPEQYRIFLRKYNGGETPETCFKIGKEDSVIRAFYGIGDVIYSFSSIEEFIPNFLEKQFLPIAVDVFGNYIVIGLEKKKDGQIWFCDHEKGFKATYLTADFKEFAKKVKSKKIDVEFCTRSVEVREKNMIANGNEHLITDRLRKIWQEEIDKYSNIKQERVVIDYPSIAI